MAATFEEKRDPRLRGGDEQIWVVPWTLSNP